ncbi:hypothetical protein [Solitalea lacus]|nr:hypothetical protein [Solitalea lacus]UKJ07049.1 hypothetical protein L2B55_16155 [Solitalea lacus]
MERKKTVSFTLFVVLLVLTIAINFVQRWENTQHKNIPLNVTKCIGAI